MMRARLKIGTGLVVWCGLLVGSAWAQEPATLPASPPEQTAPAAKPNFEPLARAFAALNSADRFTYTGETDVTGSGKGVTFTGKQRVVFWGARKPERVHADVQTQLGDDATAARRYLVVCDGTKVWTHQPGAKRYGVVLLKSGALAEEFNALGLLGALYFNKDLLSGIAAIPAENSETVLSELRGKGITLSADSETVDGAQVPVYTLGLTKQNVTIRFFVSGQTPTINRVDFTVKSEGVNLNLSERITAQSTSPTLVASVFRFAAPSGAKKTPGLEVELF